MKKLCLFLLIVSLMLVGLSCCSSGKSDEAPLDFSPTEHSGAIGDFSLGLPTASAELNEIPTFTWGSAENADSYTLEICTTTDFEYDAKQIYLKKTGLMTCSFDLVANLKKNVLYYWRVTALNSDTDRLCSDEYRSFLYNAPDAEGDVEISVGYADEWKVHEKGSKASVSIDRNDFFDNDKEESLRISFDKEDTQRGPAFVEYNGWIVVTRSLEMEFFGDDLAFYFNFYYMGNDAKAFFRLIDEDNEYWYAPIKMAMNAKQTIIIRLDEFVLRRNGTPVVNETFDYNYIKSIELVFEKVDGDGVAYFSDLRVVNYDDYKSYFIEEVDFRDYLIAEDSAYFDFTTTPSESGKTLNVAFTKDDSVSASLKGFGSIKIPINKMLSSGDAFCMNLGFDFDTSGALLTIRVIEEDNDVWVLKEFPIADLPQGDESLILPFSAFVLDEGGFKGDGIRQFYLIRQLQFGISRCYRNGSMTISNLRSVRMASILEEEGRTLYRTEIADDGTIENFEGYTGAFDVYFIWEPSTDNKDETIMLYKETVLGAGNSAAKVGYKTDLPDATYRTNFESVEGFTAIEVSAKDESNAEKGYRATMKVILYGDSGEVYTYSIKKLAKTWKKYTIPFSSFVPEDEDDVPLRSSAVIVGMAIAFRYDTPLYDYGSGNYVCLDNIRFIKVDSDAITTKYVSEDISAEIKMTSANAAMISDFDTDASYVYWGVKEGVANSAGNAAVSYVNETASGSGRSLKMTYKSLMTAPYHAGVVLDGSVKAKGITLLLNGDRDEEKAPLAEIILTVSGKTYLAKIPVIKKGWHYYSIGFSEFLRNDDGSKTPYAASDLTKIEEIAIYLKDTNDPNKVYFNGSVEMDEIYFDNSISLTTNSVRAYA